MDHISLEDKIEEAKKAEETEDFSAPLSSIKMPWIRQ